MKIALLADGFMEWAGGRGFLRSYAHTLNYNRQQKRLDIWLLIPSRFKNTIELDICDWFDTIDESIRLFFYNGALINCLRELQIDVVMLSSSSLGKDFPIPWVGYLYDFQHKYYPEFFSVDEINLRESHFGQMVREADSVIVGSRSVKTDIKKFFPEAGCKVFSVPFAAIPKPEWFDTEIDIQKKYSLPERFFLISNQFWIHKAHYTAFKAMALLKQRGHFDISIVCTGKSDDYRFPTYYTNLMTAVRNWGVEQDIHFLGFIPRIDQMQIMRKALAVIQPSLFEGAAGGGAVRNALAVGTPVIVSDIPVNRELPQYGFVSFFKTGSACDLADQCENFLEKQPIFRPSRDELLAQGQRYQEERAKFLWEALVATVEHIPSRPPEREKDE
jgi:glycosyltransferase involved in cell wall biosynthesis